MRSLYFITNFLLSLFLLSSCALTNPTVRPSPEQLQKDTQWLENLSLGMHAYAKILAKDFPKALGAIDGLIGREVFKALFPNEGKQLDDLENLLRKDGEGEWLTENEILQLPDYDIWKLSFARIRHSGPTIKSFFDIYLPGLSDIPEIARFFGFVGLGGLAL